MEVGRKMSVEREKMCVEARSMRPAFKKVQIVYYLSRNGHLQHPHYMEVTHLAHQHLRLKDVVDRLTVLRGKGMPSLYSWSCKRSYKNGYVWNDLAENDVIYPSEGAEYVLKGSELIEACSERLRHLQVDNVHVQLGRTQESSLIEPKRKSLTSQEMTKSRYNDGDGRAEEEEEEYEEKTCYTNSTTPRSRRSRGVSTDEIEEPKTNNTTAQVSLDANSFSSTTSSSLSEKSSISKRFEEGDGVGNEPLLSRNSMLLSLVACGGSASFRKAAQPRKSGSLQKRVVCKAAAAVVDDEDQVMIGSMSENPRFGNLQSEEKEYFSGSIVEATAMERIEGLKKSSSHNQERSGMAGLGEAADEEVRKIKGVKGKCITLKKSSYKHSNK